MRTRDTLVPRIERDDSTGTCAMIRTVFSAQINTSDESCELLANKSLNPQSNHNIPLQTHL